MTKTTPSESRTPAETTPVSAEAAERRTADRFASRRNVRIYFDAGPVPGPSANVSRDGLYFFADGPIRLTVEVEGRKKPVEVRGRLVRAESLNPTAVGIAVRFEEPIDPATLD
ncbi:MAG TPA: PilZ domain-containing protein [Planctomycetota bacterium]|jgi:hypothetical protein|nr:PilZ domain-containing protein [Planctomycetota bacterium]